MRALHRVCAVVLAVALAASVVSVATADASLRGRVLARGTFSGVLADGWSVATIALDQQRSVIYVDGPRGLRRTASPCSVGAPSFGRAIGSCGGPPVVLDLASGERTPIRGIAPADRMGTDVGAQWLDGATTDSAGVDHRLLLDWRTGERRELPSSDTAVYDLNRTPLVARPLASGTTLLGRPDSRIAIGFAAAGRPLRLRTPHGTLTIRRHCVECHGVQHAAGIVSWTDAYRKACAYVVRSRRLACWTPTAEQRPLLMTPGDFGVTHTRFGLVVVADANAGVGPGFDIDHDGHVDQYGYVSFYVSLRSLL